MLEIGYTFGWRISEVRCLRVRQVDISGSRTFLNPGGTKDGKGRVVKFKPGSILADLLRQCCAGNTENEFVFTHEDGCETRDFRGAWARVCRVGG